MREAGWDGEKKVLAVCPINPFWWPVKPDLGKAAELDPDMATRRDLTWVRRVAIGLWAIGIFAEFWVHGLAFDRSGMLWIQTDGNYSNKKDFEGMGNNQMLIGDPQTGEIRRFMVGPKQCEVTGITFSGDRRTVFVGIQHPGERGKNGSHWPDGGTSVPRSAVIAIRRDDGKIVG